MSKEFLQKLQGFAAEIKAESLDQRRARLAAVEEKLRIAAVADSSECFIPESILFHNAKQWDVISFTIQPRAEDKYFLELGEPPPNFREIESVNETAAEDAAVFF